MIRKARVISPSEQAEGRTEVLLAAVCSGDLEARQALISHCEQRLRQIVRRMFRQQFASVRRWEETDDAMQLALLGLHQALEHLHPHSAREFYSLATQQIRWRLIDLLRKHAGPTGLDAHHDTGWDRKLQEISCTRSHDAEGPASLDQWTEFHKFVEQMPVEEREVFDLLWYQQLSQAEAAELLGVTVRTIKRRWQRARLLLDRLLESAPPT